MMDSDGLEGDDDEESEQKQQKATKDKKSIKIDKSFKDEANELIEANTVQAKTKKLQGIVQLRLLKQKRQNGSRQQMPSKSTMNTNMDEEDPLEAFMKSMECRIIWVITFFFNQV